VRRNTFVGPIGSRTPRTRVRVASSSSTTRRGPIGSCDYLNVNRRRFLLDVVFDNGGGMSGGAIIYESQGLNDFFTTREPRRAVEIT
jgi:hypothetical protein